MRPPVRPTCPLSVSNSHLTHSRQPFSSHRYAPINPSNVTHAHALACGHVPVRTTLPSTLYVFDLGPFEQAHHLVSTVCCLLVTLMSCHDWYYVFCFVSMSYVLGCILCCNDAFKLLSLLFCPFCLFNAANTESRYTWQRTLTLVGVGFNVRFDWKMSFDVIVRLPRLSPCHFFFYSLLAIPGIIPQPNGRYQGGCMCYMQVNARQK